MTEPQLLHEARRVGLSLNDLALAMALPLEEVRQWEHSGVPRRYRARLRQQIAFAEGERALERSGVPECSWVRRWEEQVDTQSDLDGSIAELDAHAAVCPTCQSRERVLREYTASSASTGAFHMSVVGLSTDEYETPDLPRLAIVVLCVLVSLFSLARLLRHLVSFEPLGLLVYVLAIAAAITVWGSIYVVIGESLNRSAAARWLRRCLMGIPAMVAFVGIFVISGFGWIVTDGQPMTWKGGILVGAAMGLLYATTWPFAQALRTLHGT